MYPIISSMLMGIFMGAQARRRRSTSGVDASIRRVAAGIWMEVGESHGLQLAEDSELSLRGAVRGVECEIALVGEGSTTFTLGRGKHAAALGGRLAIAPASLSRAAAAKLTGGRVNTGDHEIDEGFVIVADPPTLAQAIIDDRARTALLAMRGRNPHLAIEGDTVTLELEGTEMVHENLHAIVDLLTRAPGAGPRD